MRRGCGGRAGAVRSGRRSDLDAKVAKAAAGQGREVSIPFVDHGGIRSWRAVDRDTLLLEGTHGRWYRAELMGGCFELPFAHSIGFKSNPTGDFDRSSAVLVRGQRCQVRSLTETAPPAKSRRGAVAPPAATAAQPDGAAPVEDVTLPR